MLAGLPKAPSAFNPIVNPDRAIIRRNWILGRMKELGYINPDQHLLALEQPITASFHGAKLDIAAPYIAEMVRKELLGLYGSSIYTEGYKAHTTIDSRLQKTAQQAIFDGLMAYDQRHGYRGAEQSFPLVENQTYEEQLLYWQNQLKNTPALAGMIPAIVTAVEEQQIVVMLKDNRQFAINWDQGLSNKRPFINVNQRGPRPKLASDVVTVGDLVRVVEQKDSSWRLSQLPDAQAALVSLDSQDGRILSLVGGFDFRKSKFNRITQATRQPGSNFKPFVYTAALEKGYTPATTINDAPIVFDDKKLESSWRPTNASGKFFGPTRLRQALFKSRNLVSIRLLRDVGINNAINYTGRFGFDTRQLPKDLSLALGSHSLTPLQIVSGYSAFANGGYKIEPYLITSVTDVNDQIIFRASPMTVCEDCHEENDSEAELPPEEDIDNPDIELSIEEILGTDLPPEEVAEEEPQPAQAERIIEPRVAFLIDSMLKDVVTKGTARRARSLNRSDLAGKTGTTNGPTDAWFSGYGGGIVTTTWLGFDKNQILGRREYGGSAALPIWIDFMREALKGRPEKLLKQPPDVVSVKIDPETGLLAKPGQQNAIFEFFRSENIPKEVAPSTDDFEPAFQQEETLEEEIF